MNPIGAVAALAAFFSIWFGHVAVRKIESISPTIWLPTTVFTVLGLFVEFLSLSTVNRPLSTIFGIFGMTLFIDALEFSHQQKRVEKGHAPVNPNNPRHVKILHECSSATTINLLKREPPGQVVANNETMNL